MIHYIHDLKALSSGNIVIGITQVSDIKKYPFLDLHSSITSDIKKSLKEKKYSFKEYFLWGNKYKKLFIFIEKKSNYEQLINFYGKYFPKLPDDIAIFGRDEENTRNLLEVSELSRYCFQVYKSEKKEKKTEIFCSTKEKKILKNSEEKIKNIFLARDLWETPAADLTPEIFANFVKKTKFKNIKVKILSYKDIQKNGLWLIEWVGKGSENKPCMVIMEHIVDKKKPIQWIVGKGITFDTGWNQIKPWDYMYEMKGDMWWAAVTYALMKELDRHNIDKNIVACLCLAENVVSNNAYKPSDILTWYTGKTVEIIHTDAEWRLVLADGISYLGKKYKTQSMMSIATLTWAVMVALGFRYAGIMWNDRQMIDKLLKYSQDNTEKYIELPLDDYMKEKTKSKIADFNNLDRSVHAGASMWAAFLSNFLENNEKYVHIDIAWAYINDGEPYGKMPKWMTWFGVESLSEIFLAS